MNIPQGQEPAFPFQCQGPATGPEIYYGLTKRELLATVLLAGYIACDAFDPPICVEDVKIAIDGADLLIKELSK